MSHGLKPSEIYSWLHDQQMTEERLIALAHEVYRLYVLARKARFSQYCPAERPASLTSWVKTAQLLTEAGADPSRWITAQFANCEENLPHPSNLHDKHALARYEKWLQAGSNSRETDEAATALEFYCKDYQFLRAQYPEKPISELLQQESLGPLFVWCMAKSLGLAELAERHERVAGILLQRSSWREVYKKVFPEVINKYG